MLEKVRAKDGQLVTKYNGKWLASSVDPRAEGIKWAKAHVQNKELQTVDSIAVLGAGSGYHLLGLVQECPSKRIYCIETSREIIKFCDEYHGVALASVQFIGCKNLTELLASPKLHRLLQSSYAILNYRPSVQFESENYEEMRALLLGREFWAFREIALRREDVKTHVTLANVLVDTEAMISIKTIQSMLKPDIDPSFEASIALLRELVK